MRVTHVSLAPTEAAQNAGRPALTPELLAATGARYSRSNEGLEAILAQVDPLNPDKSVDRIFKFVDYGHASIADMAPVALFLDGVSLYMAYYLWTLCPTAGGQESSTRYIKLSNEGLVSPDILGFTDGEGQQWRRAQRDAFRAYESALALWESVVSAKPEAARIPQSLLSDSSDKAKRAVARMKRNFAFDRARYFLPVGVQTNVMLVQSARAWVGVVQTLLSHPLTEANRLGELVREELSLVAPRLLRHAVRVESSACGLQAEFDCARRLAQTVPTHLLPDSHESEHPSAPFLDVREPVGGVDFAGDLAFHNNRYAYIGEGLRRTSVRFGWEAVAFAEIRDLNRHRTGTKYCPPVPVGFYDASDQLPEPSRTYAALNQTGRLASLQARTLLANGDARFIYHTLLGTQFPFEHTTTADKFLYEAELRTGTGAHYRYAKHLHDALQLWYEKYPETSGLVLEGSAEPE